MDRNKSDTGVTEKKCSPTCMHPVFKNLAAPYRYSSSKHVHSNKNFFSKFLAALKNRILEPTISWVPSGTYRGTNGGTYGLIQKLC